MSIPKFVFAKNATKISDSVSIEKDDIGIIKSGSKESASIYFIRIGQEITLTKKNFEIFDVKKTGDAFPKKICNVCHRFLDTVQFDKNQNAKNNRSVRRPSCRSCRRVIEGTHLKPKLKREWLKTNPVPVNVPFECPICNKKTIAGITSKVVLDHNRLTGEPRAWICDSCNTGIGRFKDDITILQRAIKFLEQI